ncbi:MAG: DUF4900 domain-containing protein [Candidatus Eremiobacteraeota bacterium]|nr:DUF4900 domain-containing protein [Candidatus Eremiobacteraeota bacterium]
MHKQKGTALFLTMVAITILAIIAYALVTISMIQSRVTAERLGESKAYYYARVGVSKAIDELEHDYWWGTSGVQTFQLEDGMYDIVVWAPESNQTSPDKIWKVTSSGKYSGKTRKIEAWVKLESFAKFAYFTEVEKTGYTTIWFTDRDKLTGSAHTNGYFSIYRTPQCSERMTSHNKDDSRYNSATRIYTQGGNTYTDPAKFYNYYSNYTYDYPIPLDGSPDFAFAGGQPDIPLPQDTTSVEEQAQHKFDTDVEITFLETGQIEVKPAGVDDITTIDTNDLTLHVNGDIIIKGGTMKGSATIGCTGDIKIQESILYQDKEKDILGLIAGDDIIIDTDPYTYNNIEINAIMMALSGSFYVSSYSSGNPRGTLKIFGGLIQFSRGPVGTFSSYSGQVVTGYSKDYEYDTKLINSPPPNYPTTGNIKILSLKDNGALQ